MERTNDQPPVWLSDPPRLSAEQSSLDLGGAWEALSWYGLSEQISVHKPTVCGSCNGNENGNISTQNEYIYTAEEIPKCIMGHLLE